MEINKEIEILKIKLTCCFHRNIKDNVCEDCGKKLSYCCNEEIIQDENPVDDVFKCSKCKKIQNSPDDEEYLKSEIENFKEELLQIVIEDVPWRYQDRLFEKLKGKEISNKLF